MCNLNRECSAFEFDLDSNLCNLGMKDGLALSTVMDTINIYVNNEYVLNTDGNKHSYRGAGDVN